MSQFKILHHTDTLTTYTNRAGLFSLIVKEEGIEIFESRINAGKSIICQPYESAGALNAVFVQSGKLFHTNSRSFIEAGQRYLFKDLTCTHHLSVLEPTHLIMVRQGHHFERQVGITDMVYDLISQIQKKDQYTEDHCNQVGNLAVQIATIMGLSETCIHTLLHGGKIHDVGKIVLPNSILNKPGKLLPEEFDLVKGHAQAGYDLVLKHTHDHNLADLALSHHERLDGSGYPKGLKGDQINMMTRILAVVDSFDAMITHRPYKLPMSIDEAIQDLHQHAGTWYDPDVIAVLADLLVHIKPYLSLHYQNKKSATYD